MKKIVVSILAIGLLASCKNAESKKEEVAAAASEVVEGPALITVKDGSFYKGDTPYYYVGANYWYGSLLGSKSVGDRDRLVKELDLLQSKGIDNLRILVGGDGGGNDYTVRPALQYEQGKYDEDLLEGLDFLMAEMRKRNMYAILYMGNNWEWSGGISQYLEWNGYGKVPIPNLPEYTWPQYMAYAEQFHSCEPCVVAFENHVKFIMGRTNKINGIKYTDDNTVMSWQVANEPRVLSEKHEPIFTDWLNKTVDLMESLDGEHLISTGGEGAAGFLWSEDIYERTHQNPNIDYLTMHMWPFNWGWYSPEGEAGKTLEDAIGKAKEYMGAHVKIAEKSNRPIVMSEFGLPREGQSLTAESSTASRDAFYSGVFSLLIESHHNKGALAGYNFWGFGGYGESANHPDGKWEPGDEFMADPPQEPQGFNNVYASDVSTLEMIKGYNMKVGNLK